MLVDGTVISKDHCGQAEVFHVGKVSLQPENFCFVFFESFKAESAIQSNVFGDVNKHINASKPDLMSNNYSFLY